jgi:alpha-L-rhamnosidase
MGSECPSRLGESSLNHARGKPDCQGDVCTVTPKDLYQAYGSKSILEEMWTSITTWLDKGIKRGDNGLWYSPRDGFQLSDW